MTFLHKTLHHPFNVLNIVEVRVLETASSVTRWPTKIYRQPFFSKVTYICKGPEEEGLDSFFAMRETDIIQLRYSPEEKIFIKCAKIDIPRLSVSPTYSFVRDGVLAVSAAHGGMFAMDLWRENKIIYAKKPASSVLCSFECGHGRIGRVENGPSLALYETSSYNRVYAKKFSGLKICYAFSFSESVIVLCVPGGLLFVDTSDDSEERVDLEKTTEIITNHVVCDGKILLLCNRSVLKLLKSDRSLVTAKDTGVRVTRLFTVGNMVYGFASGGEMFTFMFTEDEKKPSVFFKPYTSITGLRYLHVGAGIPALAPHGLSFTDDAVVTTRQGINVFTQAHCKPTEPILGVFTINVAHKMYVIVSHQSSTKFLECGKDGEIKEIPGLQALRDDVQTTGIAALQSTTMSMIVQVWADGWKFIRNGNPWQQGNMPGGIVASNSKQLLLSSGKSQMYIQMKDPVPDKFTYEIAWPNVYAVALSVPDPATGLSEYCAYGTGTGQGSSSLEVYVCATEQSLRTTVLSEKMPSKVTTLMFLDATRICVGMDNGGIIVGRVDKDLRCLEDVLSFCVSEDPCRMFPINLKQGLGVLAGGGRPVLLRLSKNAKRVRFSMLAMNSVQSAAQIRTGSFVTVSRGTLALSGIANTAGEVSFHKTHIRSVLQRPDSIVAIRTIERTQFVFVATKTSIMVYDELKEPHLQVVETYANEQVCAIDVNGWYKPTCLCVATRSAQQTKIRSYTVTESSTTGIQIQSPLTWTTESIVYALLAVAVNDVSNVIVSCGDHLLYLKRVNDMLQLTTRLHCPGANIRHLVYTAAFQNNTVYGVVYAGSLDRSVKLYRYMEETREFQLFCEEGTSRSVTTLSPYGDSAVCGGDLLGNVFVLEYSSMLMACGVKLDPVGFEASTRLLLKMSFHLGDVVTGTHYTVHMFQCMWYTTVAGGFGGFVRPGANVTADWTQEYEKRVKLMRFVALEVGNVFFEMTDCDHISFRSKHYPAQGVVDFDVIGLFSTFSDVRREKISNKIREAAGKAIPECYKNITPEILESEVYTFSSYFIDWRQKRDPKRAPP